MRNIARLIRKAVWGLVFVAVGILLLLSNHDLIGINFSFRQDWPAIFVLIGLSELLDSIG